MEDLFKEWVYGLALVVVESWNYIGGENTSIPSKDEKTPQNFIIGERFVRSVGGDTGADPTSLIYLGNIEH